MYITLTEKTSGTKIIVNIDHLSTVQWDKKHECYAVVFSVTQSLWSIPVEEDFDTIYARMNSAHCNTLK